MASVKTSQHKTRVIGILFLSLFGLPTGARGQQTVFNVPTTDVLERGKVYFELDISAKPNNADALNEFSSFVPRIVMGTGSRVEVGLNIAGNVQPGADTTTLVPTIKWKAYDGGDNGWAIALGNHVYIPVHRKSYKLGNHSYLMVQKTLKTKTRIGFGAGVFTRDVVAVNAVRGVGQLTFEQPITARLTVASDWYTGNHASGYWTSGGIFKVANKLTLYAGYSVGNSSTTNGNHFFLLEWGYNFN
jgi:hypothetical protein